MPSVMITKDTPEEEALERLRAMSEHDNPEETVQEILADLQRFEQKYGMSTLEFYVRFQAGEMGDAEEFMIWATLYEAYVELTQPHLAADRLAA